MFLILFFFFLSFSCVLRVRFYNNNNNNNNNRQRQTDQFSKYVLKCWEAEFYGQKFQIEGELTTLSQTPESDVEGDTSSPFLSPFALGPKGASFSFWICTPTF